MRPQTYKKVAWHILPLLFVCYVLAYLDRINVGFAKLQMQPDLHMSDLVYGTGAGIFFIGYFFFEIPANLLLMRIGARRWLSTLIILWGVVSASTLFVHSVLAFYSLRFLLGAVESGFFPGVILYLTFWCTSRYRTRATAAFMAAIPLSGFIGGPISGWILARMSTFGGLRGWQWLYLIEGLPSVALGILSYFMLDDGPQTARWLDAEERREIAEALAAEDAAKPSMTRHVSARQALANPLVWKLAGIYFGFVMASYGIGFWLPQILKDRLTSDPFYIGLLSAIPWGSGALAMIVAARYSARTCLIGAGLMGAVAFAASALPQLAGEVNFIALTVATVGVMITISAFWALPTGLLPSAAAAASIACINSLGNLAGYVCPFLIGWIRDTTGSMMAALLMLALYCFSAAVSVIFLRRKTPQSTAAGTPSSWMSSPDSQRFQI